MAIKNPFRLIGSLIAFLVFSNHIFGQFYNGSIMDFGKNRIQYKKDFIWTYARYDKYDVYFYEGGKDLSNYVGLSAKKTIIQLEHEFDWEFSSRLQFIVYTKQSDFKQSNLGLAAEGTGNIGGVTHLVGNKIILYFEGDHQQLDEQIKSGVAEVLFNEIMFGGNAREMLRNATLLSVPEWFSKGIIACEGKSWSTETDNLVRDGILSGRYSKFNRLEGKDAYYAGYAIWHYIIETYGSGVVSNILYMTRASRSIESAFQFVLGVSMESLIRDYQEYYRIRYSNLDKESKLPNSVYVQFKRKPNRVLCQPKISPDGKSLLFATNEMGQIRIWVKDLTGNKKPKQLMKFGMKLDRITDYSYPLLSWHPSGKLFAMITEDEGKVFLTIYDMNSHKGEKRPIINFDKVLDFSYSDDGKKFAMSAVQKGQSDIFIFTAASNGYEQITKDIYDDLHPRFVHGSKEIIFSSNRKDDTIRFESEQNYKAILPKAKDLFVYNCITKSNVLKRITQTPSVFELHGNDYDSVNYSFISDQNGINNRYIAHVDSVISYVDTAAHYRYAISGQVVTNYPCNILDQDIQVKAKKYADLVYIYGRYRIYTGDILPVASLPAIALKNTAFRDDNIKLEKTTSGQPIFPQLSLISPQQHSSINATRPNDALKQDSDYVDISNYEFEIQKNKPLSKQNAVENNNGNKTISDNDKNGQVKLSLSKDSVKSTLSDSIKSVFKPGPQNNYYTNFAIDNVTTQVDNSFLNGSYQPFNGGPYISPGTSALIKVNMSDLLEDYRIVGGFKIPVDLTSYEYFLSFENRKKRWDKQLVLHRVSVGNTATIDNESVSQSVVTNEAIYSIKYPFSEVACIKATATLRNDRTVYQSVDMVSLGAPTVYDTWGSGKLEYIFDNTISKGLNLLNGVRFKLFYEYYRRVDQSSSALPSLLMDAIGDHNTAPANNGGSNNFNVIGFDFRFYQKIHRNLIWAFRASGSSSFGPEKLVYYLGGVDNAFAPKFDNSTIINQNANYAFQTLASPLRGFDQNIRNGNTFFVINNELRWPIFKYFLNRPIRSDFVSNFQVIGFADVGTAWNGPNPYTNNNSITTNTYGGNPVTVTLTTQNEPLVGGFGWGVRSRILGYFVRLDCAWGIENRAIIPNEIWYLSLGYDF